jgi:hypothetical protein
MARLPMSSLTLHCHTPRVRDMLDLHIASQLPGEYVAREVVELGWQTDASSPIR